MKQFFITVLILCCTVFTSPAHWRMRNQYNSEGKKIFSKKGSAPSLTLSTAELAGGMYMITLKDKSGNTGSKKLIIRH